MKDSILVLLATYNGAKYVNTMVDSVLAQDHENLTVILSDDGSKDETTQLLQQYADANPGKVIHYRSGCRFGCAQKHFMHLLRNFHDADYIMFCDQDDYWHADKVSKTLSYMKKIEKGSAVPALVHTDLCVVDSELNVISPSFCSHSAIDGNRLSLNELLVQNVVTGCTMMMNRALAELSCRDFPEDNMMMHDWWIALIAAACGVSGFLPEATIDYRQHGNNSVGAKNVYSPEYLINRLRSTSMCRSLSAAARQAAAFASCYHDLLTQEQLKMVKEFAATENAPIWQRDRVYLKYKLLKKGSVRVAAQLLGL